MTDKNSNSPRPSNSKKIGYIVGTFPLLTTTFIDREILEAKRLGLNVTLIAIRRPPPFEMRPEVKTLAENTKYLLPVPWLRFVAANLYFGLTHFWVYISTLFYLLTRQHHTIGARLKTLLHFVEGVWAAELLRRDEIHHIHAHFADRAATVALVASRFLKIPYSLTAHANDIYVSPVLLPEKIAQAEFVTTCTNFNKTYLEQATGREIELVYHGLDLTKIEAIPQVSVNGQPPLILSVGQLKEKKGFPYLIKACRLLKDQGYDFKCEIIGEGPDRAKLEALIVDLDLQNTVILRGALPNPEVMARYTQAMLFTLPSILAENADRDGIPNVLLEAMANHVPVVSTKVSGIPEVVKDGVTGLLVDSADHETLAQAIASLLNDPGQRKHLAQNGRRFVEENFDIRRNIGRLIKLFNEVEQKRMAPKATPLPKMIFMAWIAHNRRSQLIAEKFQMPLYLIQSLKRQYFLAPLRYVLQTIKTFTILIQEKPEVIFVQNPPIFAILVVYLYAKVMGAQYIIDSHTGALLAPWWKWSLPMHAFLSRRALTTIVTNKYLEAIVKAWRANTFIIADIPTKFPQGKTFSLNGKFSVVVINTFSPDEPVGEVLKAATALPEVQFYITGDPIRAKKTFLEHHPGNVKFTGFLPDEEYLGLLRAAQAVVVLTTDNHTMQRGACEAVSLGKPIITSDWPVLREYFHKGTIHVDNSSAGIQKGILQMQEQKNTLEKEIILLQQERWLEWEEKQAALIELINNSSIQAKKYLLKK